MDDISNDFQIFIFIFYKNVIFILQHSFHKNKGVFVSTLKKIDFELKESRDF